MRIRQNTKQVTPQATSSQGAHNATSSKPANSKPAKAKASYTPWQDDCSGRYYAPTNTQRKHSTARDYLKGTQKPATTGTQKPATTGAQKPMKKASGTDGLPLQVAQLMNQLGIESFGKLCEMLKEMIPGAGEDKDLGKIIKGLGATKDGVNALLNLVRAAASFKKGDKRAGIANGIKALADAYNTLPDKLRTKIMGKFRKMLGRSKLLKGFGALLSTFDRIGAVPHLMKAVAALVEGKSTDFMNEMAEIGKKIAKESEHLSPKEKKTLFAALGSALIQLLPKKVAKKLLVKFGLRKLPVIGTVASGLWTLGKMVFGGWKELKDWKNYAALVSTAAGLFPGPGTAVSAGIDFGILLGVIKQNFDQLSQSLQKSFKK